MELKDIYAKLETIEGGAEIVNALKSEFKKRNDEAANHRTAKNKMLEMLGLTDNDDVEGSLSELMALKKSGVKSDEVTGLKKEIEKIKNELKTEKEAKAAERQKRIDAIRLSKAISALNDKAVRPDEVSRLILDKIVVKDDESIAFQDGETELDVEAGISKWLEARPEFMKSKQSPGSGSAGQTTPNVVNPFAKTSFNLTEQGKLIKSNPEQARKLAAEAGLKI